MFFFPLRQVKFIVNEPATRANTINTANNKHHDPYQSLSLFFPTSSEHSLSQPLKERYGYRCYGPYRGNPQSPPRKAFCCPWNALWCGGCAEPTAAKDGCKRCFRVVIGDWVEAWNLYLLYVPGTCLSSILGFEPSKRRPFPFKTKVSWVPGMYIFMYIYIFRYCMF